jgi:hypothetical protein
MNRSILLFFLLSFFFSGCANEKIDEVKSTIQEKQKEVSSSVQKNTEEFQKKGGEVISTVSDTLKTANESIEKIESIKGSVENILPLNEEEKGELFSSEVATNICVPKFEVSEDSSDPERRGGALFCYEKIKKEDCESIDIYNEKTDTFGSQDGISDCVWQE